MNNHFQLRLEALVGVEERMQELRSKYDKMKKDFQEYKKGTFAVASSGVSY